MNRSTRRLFPIVTALMMSLWLAGCAGETQGDAEGAGESGHAEEAGEHAAAEGGAEGVGAGGSGEHQEGNEAREGGEHREGREAREGGEHSEGGEAREGGEHGREGGEAGHGEEGGHDEEGEESGVYIGAAESWDVVRNGARLVLRFDSEANAFVGRVENTTERTLCAIRVEVHLSGGIELGPTERTDVAAGQTTSVRLPTEGRAFESWTAHPEMSACGGS